MPATAATTVPGFRNENGQVVVGDTGFGSESFPGQRVYHLRCAHCGFEYGSNGTDIAKRLCPSHQGGSRGEKLREAGPGLFDGVPGTEQA
jgi:hypothetical protein